MEALRFPELMMAARERTPESFWTSLRYFNLYRIALAALFFCTSLIYDDALNALVGRANAVKVGDGADPDTTMGPLVSKEQQERVEHQRRRPFPGRQRP